MSPTATTRPGLRLRDRRPRIADGLVVALTVATVIAAATLDRPPKFVSHVEVVNPTVYQVEVDVRSGGDPRSRWLDLGGFRRESRRTVEDVLDQGERWRVRFSYGGLVVGELTLSRAEMRHVTVPPEVGERLAEAGFAPSAS